MKKFTQKLILESKKDVINGVIMFTDIVGSSDLWTNEPKKMESDLDVHFKLIEELCNEYNGLVVKTIGDAFMLKFDDLLDAAKLAKTLIEKEKELDLRIGICQGEMFEKEQKIQGCDVLDFFGNTVNTASRMESKVSPENGFAFTYNNITDTESEEILDLLKDDKVEKIKFSNSCNDGTEDDKSRKRSARLLTDLHIQKCKDIEELKGVDELITYKITINNGE